jgi:hypothetical protein
MPIRTITATLDNFFVNAGSEITYLGNSTAGSTGGLSFRAFRINPGSTGDITVNMVKTSGVNTVEIFQEDAYTASTAPTGYKKFTNIAKDGKGKGAVGVTVTDATKNYVVILELDAYSEVSYVASVNVP